MELEVKLVEPNDPTKLTERTRIGGVIWRSRKADAMRDDYRSQPWYEPLTKAEKHRLEALRKAQKQQDQASSEHLSKL